MGPIEAQWVEVCVHAFLDHVTLHNSCVDTLEVALGGLACSRSRHNDLVCIHTPLMSMSHGTYLFVMSGVAT